MTVLTFTRVTDEVTAEAWRQIHNETIPSDPLAREQVASRSKSNVLEVAHLGSAIVGCSTVRPATDEDPVTVIVRILPAFRRRGLGSEYLVHALAEAQRLDAVEIQTIVLATNHDGLAFALRRGFVETERYTLDGDTVPYIHLARPKEELPRGQAPT